ncbi:MAG: NAD(P)-dependent alcohol dehydrogenase [Rikenellaceae bacterium]|nr:NAD(P)-dependent alcohol dehydrogenase [Rikenellaceae bacterium]
MKKILCSMAFLLTTAAVSSAQQNYSDDHQINPHGERVLSKGMVAMDNSGIFVPYEFTRHAVGDNNILIEIMYSGICHSDIHHVHEDWKTESYPLVPGHEIAGWIVRIGKDVAKFKVGDYAGVGCLVNSCGSCEYCLADQEQYCETARVLTYGSPDVFHGGEMTQGGYSNNIVVSEDFAISIPEGADLTKVAPLLCAGITTYSPLMQIGVNAGDKVAIAGFGGLGHMAVQYAVALGAQVTVFDITEEKRQLALDMGASKYANVNDPQQMEGMKNYFNTIISTIPASYDVKMYVDMLAIDGSLAFVGLSANKDVPSIDIATLIFQGRRNLFCSQIGGIKETQEMLDYSVANGIYPMVEIIEPSRIEQAYKDVIDGKVHFRYVIDMSNLN